MSVYTSCAYECIHKDIGRKLVKDLNKIGIQCFFAGDIPNDRRYGMLDVIAAANERSEVFMPFLCGECKGGRFRRNELAFAHSYERVIMPVVLDPDFVCPTPGGLLTGVRVTNISSSDKFENELPEIIRTIRSMIPGATVPSGIATGSAAGNQDA